MKSRKESQYDNRKNFNQAVANLLNCKNNQEAFILFDQIITMALENDNRFSKEPIPSYDAAYHASELGEHLFNKNNFYISMLNSMDAFYLTAYKMLNLEYSIHQEELLQVFSSIIDILRNFQAKSKEEKIFGEVIHNIEQKKRSLIYSYIDDLIQNLINYDHENPLLAYNLQQKLSVFKDIFYSTQVQKEKSKQTKETELTVKDKINYVAASIKDLSEMPSDHIAKIAKYLFANINFADALFKELKNIRQIEKEFTDSKNERVKKLLLDIIDILTESNDVKDLYVAAKIGFTKYLLNKIYSAIKTASLELRSAKENGDVDKETSVTIVKDTIQEILNKLLNKKTELQEELIKYSLVDNFISNILGDISTRGIDNLFDVLDSISSGSLEFFQDIKYKENLQTALDNFYILLKNQEYSINLHFTSKPNSNEANEWEEDSSTYNPDIFNEEVTILPFSIKAASSETSNLKSSGDEDTKEEAKTSKIDVKAALELRSTTELNTLIHSIEYEITDLYNSHRREGLDILTSIHRLIHNVIIEREMLDLIPINLNLLNPEFLTNNHETESSSEDSLNSEDLMDEFKKQFDEEEDESNTLMQSMMFENITSSQSQHANNQILVEEILIGIINSVMQNH